MSEDKKNLRFNTYRVGRGKLDQFYQNSKNNIEDPIFTGFTFDIDTLNSPLFYTVCGKEFMISESLRSQDGKDTSLSETIEQKLSDAYRRHIFSSPEGYEMNTMLTKDEIGSANAGYGLQEKYYMDKPVYGAADYIYMVDKVSDSLYTDDIGTVDLGNGTNTNIYEEMAQTIEQYRSGQVQIKVDGVDGQKDQIIDVRIDPKTLESDTKLEKMSDEELLNNYKNSLEQVKTDNETTHNKNKDEAKTLQDEYDVASEGLKSLKKQLKDNTEGDVYYKALIQRKISDAKSEAQKFIESTTTSGLGAKVREKFNELCTFLNRSSKDVSTLIRTEGDRGGFRTEKTDVTIKYTYESQMQESYMLSNSNTTKSLLGFITPIAGSENDSSKKLVDEDLTTLTYKLKFKTITEESIASAINNKLGKEASKTEDETKEKKGGFFGKFEDDDDDKKTSSSSSSSNTSFNQLKSSYPDLVIAYFLMSLEVTLIDTEKNEKSINLIKESLANESKQLYGEDGSEENPKEDSPYGQLLKANDKLNRDAYSQADDRIGEINDILATLDDIQDYMKSEDRAGKVEKDSSLPSMDQQANESDQAYEARVGAEMENLKTARQTYEVPQTVYDMMGFINGMIDITQHYPYVFQTINGLDEAYKNYFEIKDPYMGSGDNVIKIECLEFLDLKISSLFNKYFNAVYDRQYRRERVPMNLKRFECSVFVHDIRNFKDALNGGEFPGGGDLKPLVEMALNYVSAIEFKFYDCEFIPGETGGIFNTVTNINNTDPVKTEFAFSYGNCVINFLPFEDLKRYLFNQRNDNLDGFKPKTVDLETAEYKEAIEKLEEESKYIAEKDETGILHRSYMRGNDGGWRTDTVKVLSGDDKGKDFSKLTELDDGTNESYNADYRRWFDRSELGNVNNNDYRDYVRRDSSVAVDDYYKSTMVDSFALNSVVNKNKELTYLDDALRKIVVGIAASTGIPTLGVTDALNIQFIDPILNQKDLDVPVVTKIGNVNNSEILDVTTTKFIGRMIEKQDNEDLEFIDFLGNVNDIE